MGVWVGAGWIGGVVKREREKERKRVALCNTGSVKCHVCCGSPLRLSRGGSMLGSQRSCWGHSALLMQSHWKDLHRSPDPAKSIERQEAIRSYTLTYSHRDTHNTHSNTHTHKISFRLLWLFVLIMHTHNDTSIHTTFRILQPFISWELTCAHTFKRTDLKYDTFACQTCYYLQYFVKVVHNFSCM